jgi:transcription termination/antitermination protein NusG
MEEITNSVTSQSVDTDEQRNKAKWYIVHTYSGHENKVKSAIEQRIVTMNLKDFIFDILVPVHNKIIIRKGKKETIQEKIFPGYIIIKMILNDHSWLAVRTTQGVTAFIGIGNKPIEVPEEEVKNIQKFLTVASPSFKSNLSVGEAVKIIDGPFAEFLGSIESIDEERGKVKVLVSIFGRETPVELDFLQISKL